MTLGKQILENYSKKNPEQVETRELGQEVYKNKIRSLIEKTIQEGLKEYRNQKFYIVWYGYKDGMEMNMAHCKIIGRLSRPIPEWRQTVFSYDPRAKNEEAFRYEWMLPDEKSAQDMLLNPDGFHPHLIENIKKYRDGSLK